MASAVVSHPDAVVKCWGRIVLSAQANSKRLSNHKGGVNSGDELRRWGVNGRLMAPGAIAAGENGRRLRQVVWAWYNGSVREGCIPCQAVRLRSASPYYQ
jgi:hypothetical protein